MSAVTFTVYVAGRSPNSLLAVENLRAICERHFNGSSKIDVVDAMADPARALADGILVTPTVVRVSPEPRLVLIGNLTNENSLTAALGLGNGAHPLD